MGGARGLRDLQRAAADDRATAGDAT